MQKSGQTEKVNFCAIDAVNTNGKAVKVLRDGQLLIEKNGKTYNIIWAELRW